MFTNKYLSTTPLVNYLEVVRKKRGLNLNSLAEHCGISARRLSDYVVIKDGHVTAKKPMIRLDIVDSMLTHAGDETLHTMYSDTELEVTTAPRTSSGGRCRRCKIDLSKTRKGMLCGFCIEETTGRTLTYRQRELY